MLFTSAGIDDPIDVLDGALNRGRSGWLTFTLRLSFAEPLAAPIRISRAIAFLAARPIAIAIRV